jgi:glutamyl-tRNA synthetase
MPDWAHLPLILKPDGHGKLSKRDGERLGFPVFTMDWTDPRTNETATGFKERGFMPEAFINMLAMLGWNDGTGKEMFSLNELINSFDVKRIHKGGAKFDYEKAKWYNHEWIKQSAAEVLLPYVTQLFEESNVQADTDKLLQAIDMVKERCTFVNDFLPQASFLFQFPTNIEIGTIQQKWDVAQHNFFTKLLQAFETYSSNWDAVNAEQIFKEVAAELSLKPAQLMLPLRIMLVGGKFGPGVFDIAAFIGKAETCIRINHSVSLLQQQ